MPTASSTPKPPVIIVGPDTAPPTDIENIEAAATVYKLESDDLDSLIALLKEHQTASLYIAEPDLTTSEYCALSDFIVDWVRNGGTAVLGGGFSSWVNPAEFDSWMVNAWQLPWKIGQYTRSTVHYQSAAKGPARHPNWRNGLLAAYSSKAVYLSHVDEPHRWYIDVVEVDYDEDSEEEDAPRDTIDIDHQTSVAFARVGRGWLGYTGDVNAEKGTCLATLSMLGINK